MNKKQELNKAKKLFSLLLLTTILFVMTILSIVPVRAYAEGEGKSAGEMQAEHEKEKASEYHGYTSVFVPNTGAEIRSKEEAFIAKVGAIPEVQKELDWYLSTTTANNGVKKEKMTKEELLKLKETNHEEWWKVIRGFADSSMNSENPTVARLFGEWRELQIERSHTTVSSEDVRGLQTALVNIVGMILKVSTPIAVLMFVATLIAQMLQTDEKKLGQLRAATKGVMATWIALMLFYPIINFIMSKIAP